MVSNIAAVAAAVDAGDDGALPILVDALLDEGDPRAAGLLIALADRRDPGMWPRSRYGWRIRREKSRDAGAAAIPGDIWGRLLDPQIEYLGVPGRVVAWAFYPSRSATYLALAAALTFQSAPA